MIIQCEDKIRYVVRENIRGYIIKSMNNAEGTTINKFCLIAYIELKEGTVIGSFNSSESAEAYLHDIAESEAKFFSWQG